MKDGFECDCLKLFINLMIKLIRVSILTIGLLIFVYSIPDINIDPSIISDKLLQSTFFFGKKIHKINYDDVQKGKAKDKAKNERYWHRPEENIQNIQNNNNEIDNQINNQINKYKEKVVQTKLFQDESLNNTVDTEECYEDFDYTPYLYQLYGNRTVFQMDLEDLENLVNKTYLTIGQSLVFWETLLQRKTNRANEFDIDKLSNPQKSSSPNNTKYKNIDLEVIILNYLPVRSLGVFLICCLILFITYFVQTRTKFTIRVYVIYNICTIQFGFLLMNYLYYLKYYLSSSFITANIALAIRQVLELIFFDTALNRNDINIFKFSRRFSNLLKQSLIKITILLITMISLCIIAKEYPFLGNYLVFYASLYYTVYVSAYYLMIEANSLFQPLRQLLFGVVGLINLLLTSFHKHIIRFPSRTNMENDSLYLISSMFSLVCFYIFLDYVKIQAFNISSLYDNLSDEDLNEKIDNMVIKEKSKDFKFTDDVLWILLFSLFLFLIIVALYFKHSLNFHVCSFTLSGFLSPFGRLFKIKQVRIINLVVLFIFLFTNQIMSNLKDVLDIQNVNLITIIKLLSKTVGLIIIFSMIILNFDLVYEQKFDEIININIDNSDNESDSYEEQTQKKLIEIKSSYERRKKKNKTETEVVNENISVPFSIWNLFYVLLDIICTVGVLSLLYFLILYVEINMFINFIYISLVFIFYFRIYFILREVKNTTEYRIAFLYILFFCFRLMILTTKYNILYIPTCFAILCFLLNYITSKRTNFYLSCFALFLLFSESLFFESIFLVVCFFISSLLLTFQYVFKRQEKIFSAISIFIQINCFLFAQLYGFKSIYDSSKVVEDYFINLCHFDPFGLANDFIHIGGSYYNEIFTISKMYDNINILLIQY